MADSGSHVSYGGGHFNIGRCKADDALEPCGNDLKIGWCECCFEGAEQQVRFRREAFGKGLQYPGAAECSLSYPDANCSCPQRLEIQQKRIYRCLTGCRGNTGLEQRLAECLGE